MTTGADDGALCPSAPAAPDSQLIGVIEPEGRVANLVTPLTVDAAFIERARQDGPPEVRFRFASACQQSRCSHWAGNECGLIGRLKTLVPHSEEEPLQPCAIRDQCRWWRQRGRQACAVCSLVVTGSSEVAGGYIPA